ncbi:hypothetical protein E8E15_003667 [Penicillium rubens]|uniref:Pc16g02190 protein n=2 Tax=Penicillium chrysogenum species complex TaxID=254878 RepID=B6H790_PENRW|nr:uncharacterized protein N7525_011463 [Penicillium rubens]KZN83520.1 Serine/threonine-protein kinase [Penicillium chrysogenum]CAP92889.1 Pc16g02190 [Penicillium rubens Wisconsin 54-1255]KAF3015716.1 hypothetical protein E8E15_003667 [Penicillium rubens]KAJ5037091.1 hypothetical protein NUH16_004974 [Penicillium rubens]KAJ5822179.1 hypothetical protein N7525_011463 [Penicillium rubens]
MTSILEWLKRLFGKRLFNLEWLRSLFRRSLKFPVSFPKAGWAVIPADEKVEEEQMPGFYEQNYFLPVTMGEILLSRYQAVGKLGWGTTSTVWLVRDLEMNDYKALKLFALDVFAAEESAFYDQTKQGNQQHPGANRVRAKIGNVMIPRKDWMYYDDHLALVQTPLGESLQDLQIRSAGERLDKLSIQSTIYQMLLALDYLHTECHLIHGDIKGDNIFQEIGDKTRLDRYVQAEMENPSPRKFADDYPIYRSRPLEPASELGILQLGDFGASAQGDQPRNGKILQPGLYRSPEVVLKKEWNYPVDVWNLAVWAWCAFEGSPLFQCTDTSENKRSYSVSLHLAQFTGLLGPPPPDLIEPDTISAEYFDKDGNLVAKDREVKMTSFEELEKHLEGEDKEMFLDLMRGMITWRPEDRKTPKELIKHPWLQAMDTCFSQAN